MSVQGRGADSYAGDENTDRRANWPPWTMESVAMTKWIVLAFIIPEVLVLIVLGLLSPIVIVGGGRLILPFYFFFGCLGALVPGILIWAVSRSRAFQKGDQNSNLQPPFRG